MNNEKKPTTKKTGSTTKKSTAKKSTTKKPTAKRTTTTKKTTTKKVSSPKVTNEKKPSIVEEPILEKHEPVIENKINDKKVESTSSINYQMIIIVILAALLIVLVLVKNMGLAEKRDLTKSYLIQNEIVKNELNKDNLNDIKTAKRAFVLITSLNSEEEYNLEKELKPMIKEFNLADDFYVFDTNSNSSVDLSNTFDLGTRTIKIPTVLYYENGVLLNVITREDEKMMEAADFRKLLDMFEIAE